MATQDPKQPLDYGLVAHRDKGRRATEQEIRVLLQRYPTELGFVLRTQDDQIAMYWCDDSGNVRKVTLDGEKLT